MKTYDFSLLLLNGKNLTFFLFPLLVLFFQNLIIFWNHYFNNWGFPWDFDKSYYALPAFWTTAISEGIIPQWIPFQSMGYPLFMNAQSGFYYPFLWIFPILNIPYTLDAAVIFQVLHVFFGSVGMFFLLNHMFKSPKYAFIGALAFQFFGGFYANSEHVDIVRAFAILPWLFYVFSLNKERLSIRRNVLFIPIVIFVLATGAYPGNFISSIFIMFIFVGLQALDVFFKRKSKRESILTVTFLWGLMFLGVALAAVHIGPFTVLGDELTRFNQPLETLKPNILELNDFPGYFMSNNAIPKEISMTSTFLTLPIIILATFFPFNAFRKLWVYFVIFILGILMSMGPSTIFWESITSIVPQLELSRLPVSDYRIFIAIPLLIFGLVGLKALVEKTFSVRSFGIRTSIVAAWFSLGIFLLYNNSGDSRWTNPELEQQIVFAIVILISSILILFFLNSRRGLKFSSVKKTVGLTVFTMIIISAIITVDGGRVVYDMISWKRITADERYVRFNEPLEKDGKLITYSIFQSFPNERPEREITQQLNRFSWRGYLDGSYMMQDTGNTVLNARTLVFENEQYKQFMFKKWTGLLLEIPSNQDESKLHLPETVFSDLGSDLQQTSVIQTYYGINDIEYTVSLSETKLMVENEIFFPGWEGKLVFMDKEIIIQPIVVNDIFRAWVLPEGDYKMVATFQFPNHELYQVISISALILWISITIIFWNKINRNDIHEKIIHK